MSFEVIATNEKEVADSSRKRVRTIYPHDTNDMFEAEASRYRNDRKINALDVVHQNYDFTADYLKSYAKRIPAKKVVDFVIYMIGKEFPEVGYMEEDSSASAFWASLFPKDEPLPENRGWWKINRLLKKNGFKEWNDGVGPKKDDYDLGLIDYTVEEKVNEIVNLLYDTLSSSISIGDLDLKTTEGVKFGTDDMDEDEDLSDDMDIFDEMFKRIQQSLRGWTFKITDKNNETEEMKELELTLFESDLKDKKISLLDIINNDTDDVEGVYPHSKYLQWVYFYLNFEKNRALL